MANNLNGIPLPLLKFENELSRSAVVAQTERAKAGNLLLYAGTARNLPIDLSGDSDGAWMERSDLLELKALADIPNAVYPMEYNGENYTVRFRHEDAPVIEAEPLKLYGNPPETAKYRNIRIRLTEI